MQMNSIFKEFENLSVRKRRFRLRWDSSPGLSIAGRLLRCREVSSYRQFQTFVSQINANEFNI